MYFVEENIFNDTITIPGAVNIAILSKDDS